MNRNKGIRLLFLVAMLWGGGYIGVNVTIDSFTTFPLLAIRFLCASSLLFVLFRKKINVDIKKIIKYGKYGVFLFLGFMFQTLGLKETTVANNAFFTSLSVVIVPYLSWLIKGKKPNINDLVASILALLAIVILVYDKETLQFRLNRGDIITLLGTLSFSIQIILISEERSESPFTLSFIQMSIAGCLALILSVSTKSFPSNVDIRATFGVIYLIIFATLLPYLIQTHAIRFVETNTASVILSTESMFATIFAVVILKDPFKVKTLVSLLLMILAVYVSSKGRKTHV